MDGRTTGSPQDSSDTSSEDPNGSSGVICGDGECEAGESMADVCTTQCAAPRCGDGLPGRGEECDAPGAARRATA